MKEALKDWTFWLAKWWLVGLALTVAFSNTPLFRDNTDPGDWGKRSSIAPRTDSLTGCQYLTTSSGGLTPRLDVDGKHIGCRETLKETS